MKLDVMVKLAKITRNEEVVIETKKNFVEQINKVTYKDKFGRIYKLYDERCIYFRDIPIITKIWKTENSNTDNDYVLLSEALDKITIYNNGHVLIMGKKENLTSQMIELAENLKKCFAQRSLTDRYSKLLKEGKTYEEILKETFIIPTTKEEEEEIKEYYNFDWVEEILIFADSGSVMIYEGAFTITCNINDIEIEPFNYKGWEQIEKIDKIRIKYKENSIILYDCGCSTFWLCRINKDGFGEKIMEIPGTIDYIIY